MMSSFAPMRKMMINEHKMYCKSPKRWKGVQRIIEKISPAKMPIPPSEGVLTV